MAQEEEINWGVNPIGRIAQIERQFTTFEARAKGFASQLAEKTTAIAQLETENQQQITGAAHAAYTSLEAVVHSLLLIENGSKTLSRQDAHIVQALDDSAASFRALHDVSSENMSELGVKAGDCMALADVSKRFMSQLESTVDSIDGAVSYIWNTHAQHSNTLQSERNSEQGFRNAVSSAESEEEGVGNNILGFFNSDVKRQLRDNVDNAKWRLHNNLLNQKEAKEKLDIAYDLAITHRNASAALRLLASDLRVVSKSFETEFKRVTDSQDAENRLCSGLGELRNVIWAGDWTSTRDASLRVVLELLEADDEVLRRQPYYEAVEARIRGCILQKMGEGGFQKLLSPVPVNHSIDVY